MKTTSLKSANLTRLSQKHRHRLGSIIVLSALMMVMIFAFTAFSIDLSYIAVTKTQLQAASDASAHGAAIELAQGFGSSPASSATVQTQGEGAAVAVAATYAAGGESSTYVDPAQDIRFGQLEWNDLTGTWEESWGTGPYNLVEVTVRRDGSSNGSTPLPLFFAPVVGQDSLQISLSSQAALLPASGFKVPIGSGKLAGVMPIAIDETSWNDLMDGVANSGDSFSHNPDTNAVTNSPDGIMELNIYPDADPNLPAGNRGTVNFGSGSNSTADLSRQILNGLNETDLSYFLNNELSVNDGPLDVGGDPGISAGIKDELATIIGQQRAFPLFSTVVDPGSNAVYTIVRFVGGTIVDVDLTGNPKRVIIQPSAYIDNAATRSTGGTSAVVQDDSVFAPLFIYK